MVTPGDSVRKMNWRYSVKPFRLLKIPMVLVGVGALVIFAPSCKAQSEVSPDHFDGTDTWEVAARKPIATKAKAAPAPTVFRAKDKKASANASVQLASVREKADAMPPATATFQDKKKLVVRKSDNK